MDSFLLEATAVLERTPAVVDAMLRGLPDRLIHATEGPGTWSAYSVVGHLIHGERTDWMPRIGIILGPGPDRTFERFDREAQFRATETAPLNDLLDEFRALRISNLDHLRGLRLGAEHLEREGTHPDLGRVTLRQLLATWTAHDLAHIVQISRTMARAYRGEVGPWAAYLSVMR